MQRDGIGSGQLTKADQTARENGKRSRPVVGGGEGSRRIALATGDERGVRTTRLLGHRPRNSKAVAKPDGSVQIRAKPLQGVYLERRFGRISWKEVRGSCAKIAQQISTRPASGS